MTLPLAATEESVLFLTPPDVEAILPHRGRMLFITEGVRIDVKNRRASTVRRITEDDCDGHFPGHPVFPGVHHLEIVAQLLGVLAGVLYRTNGLGFLASFRGCRYRSSVFPGDTIFVTAELDTGSPTRVRGHGYIAHGNGSPVSEIDSVLILCQPASARRSSPTLP